MAGETKVKIKQKTGASTSITIYPHTSADVVEFTQSSNDFQNPNGSVGKAIEDILATIDALPNTLVASVNGKYGTVTLYGTDIASDSSHNTKLIDSSTGKFNMGLMPDAVVGQLTFGGIINADGVSGTTITEFTVELTNSAKTILDCTESVIKWDDTQGNTKPCLTMLFDEENTASQDAVSGIYFIVGSKPATGGGTEQFKDLTYGFKAGGTTTSLTVTTGDWIVFIGDEKFEKVDNTDAVASVNGQTGTVSITAASLNAVTTNTTETINAFKTFADGIGIAQSKTVIFNDSTTANMRAIRKNSTTNLPQWYDFGTATAENFVLASDLNSYLPKIGTGYSATTGGSFIVKAANNADIALITTGNDTGDIYVTATDGTLYLYAYDLFIKANNANYGFSLDGSKIGSGEQNPTSKTLYVPNANAVLAVGVNSGTKSDGTTAITASAADNGMITLGNSGISAGTYSAIKVNSKGIAVEGGYSCMVLEYSDGDKYNGSTVNGVKYAKLCVGGIFFEEDQTTTPN